jgi:hypothetical protein
MFGGCRVYISSEEFFNFFNDQSPRPSNLLFQIVRGAGTILNECPFSSKKRTSLRRLLQEKTTSRLLFERTRTGLVSPSEAREIRRLSSSTMKCSGACRWGTHRVPPAIRFQVVSSSLAHGSKQERVQQLLHLIRVE